MERTEKGAASADVCIKRSVRKNGEYRKNGNSV